MQKLKSYCDSNKSCYRFKIILSGLISLSFFGGAGGFSNAILFFIGFFLDVFKHENVLTVN